MHPFYKKIPSYIIASFFIIYLIKNYFLLTKIKEQIAEIKLYSKDFKDIYGGLQKLEQEVGAINSFITTPIIENLDWHKVGNNEINILSGPLKMNIDVLPLLSTKISSPSHRDETRLPVPWPEKYVKTYKQYFNPHVFTRNCAAIAFEISKGSTLFSNQIPYLLGQLKKYTNDENKVFYDFNHTFDRYVLKKGWTSALGNGAVVIGLTILYKATRDEKYKEMARNYLEPLKWTGKDTDIVRVDDSGYLWFEETPPIHGKPTSVYNGHMKVVLSLYYYQQVTGDKSFEPYLRAGLATSARYTPQARRPGKTLWYNKLDTLPDYGPKRTYSQILLMYYITGNRVFKNLSDALKTDGVLNERKKIINEHNATIQEIEKLKIRN